jgi:GNAT superfamily N-acetyltransferase
MEPETITRVGTQDIDALLPLMRGYCDFYKVSPSDEALRALSAALISDPQREGVQLIARTAGGDAVGFATVYWSWSTSDAGRLAIMNDLFIVEGARGHGLAERLIEACRAAATEHGAVSLAWQTAPDNRRAQAVYDRVGATREQWVDYWLPCPKPSVSPAGLGDRNVAVRAWRARGGPGRWWRRAGSRPSVSRRGGRRRSAARWPARGRCRCRRPWW